tara:strand:+ start:2542 stop:3225 length:684 start_codon:yes stop_codon:yes gene_type:complete
MGVQLKNNVSSLLVGSISAAATSIVVTTGSGANFPSLGAGDYFYVTLIASTGVLEIVKCTTRVNDVLTVTRAQENTLAIPFPDGSRVELRVTAKSIRDLVEEYNEASEISFVPTGVITSTNVQDAIVEVSNEYSNASAINIADAGNVYIGASVEAALQELRTPSISTFTGDGTTVIYTLAATLGVRNLTSVHINGVYQNKSTYTLSGTTLTFSEAPPLNTVIEVLTR